MILDARRKHNESLTAKPQTQHVVKEAKPVQATRREGAVRVDDEQGWSKQIVGAAALLGCAGVWLAGSLFESM
jgi:phosphatidylinositol glycan class K